VPFTFEPMEIPDVVLVRPRVFEDERGFFLESYKRSDFVAAGINEEFVQSNHSFSAKGVIRGLHYQKNPAAQSKLVRAIAGVIFDVAVDIRKGSPTFGKWVGVELSAENKKMLYIPVGFAHGFAVLSDTAEVMYKTTNEYCPEADAGIAWDDPAIGIDWCLAEPVLSGKDMANPLLEEAEIL